MFGLWTNTISRTVVDELLWVLNVLKKYCSSLALRAIRVLTEPRVSKILSIDKGSPHFYLSANESTRRNYARITKQMEKSGGTENFLKYSSYIPLLEGICNSRLCSLVSRGLTIII